jgi:molecular chaperone HscB
LADIAALLDDAQYAQAGERVRQLMFIEKFGDEVARAFEALEA